MPISRRYRVDCMFNHPRIKGTIFTDTMTRRYKPLDNNSYAQVFSKKSFFDDAYPVKKKSLTGQGLREIIVNLRVMDRLFCNGSK